MSKFESGRINQKLRTRDLLVSTAIALLRKGKMFTVAEVAKAARVGRATAYEYFPTQAQLVSQALLTSVSQIDYDDKFDKLFRQHPEPEIRVARVVEVSDDSIRIHDGEYRAMLRQSLEQGASDQPRRPHYRIRWLERALEAIEGQLSKQKFERLIAALGLCVGIEPAIVLRDIYGLSGDDARAVKLWAAQALLQQALAEAGDGKRRARRTKSKGAAR